MNKLFSVCALFLANIVLAHADSIPHKPCAKDVPYHYLVTTWTGRPGKSVADGMYSNLSLCFKEPVVNAAWTDQFWTLVETNKGNVVLIINVLPLGFDAIDK